MAERHSVAVIDRMEDDELVAACVETGEDPYFWALYNRYKHKVFRRCFSFCRHAADAEDLAQEVFVKVFLYLPRFRRESSFSTWLYRITTNHCLNFLRDRKEFLALEETSVAESPVEPSSLSVGAQAALKQLPRAVQTLLLLKFRDGYTYEEIADMTGLSVSAAKMRISRAKKQLSTEN